MTIDLNILERAVARLSPQWGARRLSSKVALEQASIYARAYDAARNDRRTKGWLASGGSAVSEVGAGLPLVRRRTRDLIRNNEWAANAKRKLVAHIVGTGFQPRAADSVSRTQKRKAAELWASFAETCDPEGMVDIYGKMAMAIGEVVEGGSCLIRYTPADPALGMKVPLYCEVLDAEMLDHGRTEIRPDGNVVVQGVEFDSAGRRVAYWLFKTHPGDGGIISYKKGGWQSERVSAQFVDHVFRVDRTGQVTGMPWFAPIALRLRDTGDYEEAELVRKKIEACLTVFVRRTGQGPVNLAQANRVETDDDGSRLEKIAPGMIAYLRDGEDISTATPSPSSGYGEHVTHQLMAAAAGIGLPYSVFSGDLSRANYSSLREGKLDFWAVLDQWQWHMAIPQMANKMWRRCMAAAASRGHSIAGDTPAAWTVPKRPWVDPIKDVKAALLEMSSGLELWSDKVAERGYDPEDRLAALKALKDELAAAGVSFADTPNAQAASAAGGDAASQAGAN